MNKNRWVQNYIQNWQKSKWQAFGICCTLIIGAIFIPLFAVPDSLDSIRSGSGVPTNTRTIASCIVVLILLLYLLWYIVVAVFRQHYNHDLSPMKQNFFVWWLDKIQWWRQVSLFLTTIVFLPVARVILAQFECYCPSDHNNTPLTDSPDNLECSILIYPYQSCFPSRVTAIQIFAFVFGVLYVLGIPLFFYRLIKEGVSSMVDRHGYLEEESLVNEAIKQLKSDTAKDSTKKRENNLTIKRLKKQLKEFYFNRVNQNRSPQTYLYAAYQRKWRYWKLYQMAVKLILIIISFFLPQLFFGSFKYILANVLVCGYTIIAFISRPFNSSIEDTMDLTSHLANSINAIFALLLGTDKVSDSLATGILIFVNVLVLVLFIGVILISPISYFKSRREKEQAKKSHAKNYRLVLERMGSGLIQVHEIDVKQAEIELGMGASLKSPRTQTLNNNKGNENNKSAQVHPAAPENKPKHK